MSRDVERGNKPLMKPKVKVASFLYIKKSVFLCNSIIKKTTFNGFYLEEMNYTPK